ncbi:MAG: hypothetical protein IPN71_12950 [Fibrobacteres bacterium]|nr:hypothetical protein [Fibrobacterota bacterium]
MDILKIALCLATASLTGCWDPFAPSSPEPPSSGTGQFATTAQQMPQRFGEMLQAKDPSLLGNLLGDPVSLADPLQTDMDQVGLQVCVQRIASAMPGSQLRWWNSNPTSTASSTTSSSDTVVLALDYRLERVRADLMIDTLAMQQGSRWTVRRANPSEWRLLRWSDPSGGSSMRQLCGSPR